jgi:hypothetical protein
MNFEDLQRAWQAQPKGVRVDLATDVLLREARRKQRKFTATIFWRDVREVGAAAILTWLFLKDGIKSHDWSLDLMAFACLGVGLYMIVDCLIQHRRRPVKNDTLRTCIESSLRQVKHQIWLLKNAFWNYVLPLLAGEIIFSVRAALKIPFDGIPSIMVRCASVGFSLVIFGGVAWGVTWLNQFAVRKTLEPRREQLENLLKTLE